MLVDLDRYTVRADEEEKEEEDAVEATLKPSGERYDGACTVSFFAGGAVHNASPLRRMVVVFITIDADKGRDATGYVATHVPPSEDAET